MYDADYESYLEEIKEELKDAGVQVPGEYVTRDSGKKAQHSDGVVRDTDKGKPRFDLIFPKGVPFDDQLMTRTAKLYERGGEIYGFRNWEKSNTEETLEHHEAALMRHVVRFLTGTEDGEDHAAAVVWNVNAVDLCRRKIKERIDAQAAVAADKIDLGDGVTMEIDPAEREEPDWDLKNYSFPYLDRNSAHKGEYSQRIIQAHNYKEAKQKFDEWAEEYHGA